MPNTQYELFGNLYVVPTADLENMQSAINRSGDTRLGGDSVGKHVNKRVIQDTGSTKREVMAMGANPAAPWNVVDGSAVVTPLNIGTLTLAVTDPVSTYSAGVLTANAANASLLTKTITSLPAGRYYIKGVVGRKTGIAPKLTLSGAATLTHVFLEAPISADLSSLEEYAIEFTVPTTGNLTVTITVVDDPALTNDTGAVHITATLDA